MEAVKRSLSFQKHRRTESDSQLIHLNNHERESSLDQETRASLDTLVIQHRTRYPSDQTRNTEPSAIDRHVAARLLTRTHSEPSILIDPVASTTTISKRQSSGTFVDNYNNFARVNGLSEISAFGEDGDDELKHEKKPSADTPSKTTKKTFLQRLSRKHSVSSISPKQSKAASQALSLRDICRLGGVSSFSLSSTFATSQLLIPTAVAATGSYLVDHGPGTPGIFRIPGQSSVVNALYDYFKSRLATTEDNSNVETTIASSNLPSDILYNLHDVASTFKRFLWDLPGGILGSISLFKALAEVQAHAADKVKVNDDSNDFSRPKLIALVLLSMKPETRFALICAVFGLLAFLKQDAQGTTESCVSGISTESMSSHALGVVFAPILLGNLTDQIEFHDGRKKHESSATHKTPRRGLLSAKKDKKPKSADCGPEIAASVSRANAAAGVVEMLVQNWEDIIQHFYAMQDKPMSRSASRSSMKRSSKISRVLGSHDLHRHLHRPSVPLMSSRRTASLTRSVSDTDLTGPIRFLGSGSTTQQAIMSRYGDTSFPSRSDSSSTSTRNDSRVVSSARNISYSSSALHSINENSRWPSIPLPGDRHVIRSSGGSGESAPWWENAAVSTPPLEKSTPRAPANTSFSRFASSDEQESMSVEGQSLERHEVKRPAMNPAPTNVPVLRHTSDGSYYPADSASQASENMIRRIVSPKGSLDSVLSPLSRTDGPLMARSSSRSLQSSTTRLTTNNLVRTPSSQSPRYLHPEVPSSAKSRRSPINESQTTTKVRTPRPTPSPANVGHRLDGSVSARSGRIVSEEKWHPNAVHHPEYQGHYEMHHNNNLDGMAKRSHLRSPYEHGLQAPMPPFADHRHPHLLPFPDQPEIARRLNFRPTVERHRSVRESSDEYSAASSRSSQRPNIGTLYAEISRLKNDLDGRYDEIMHLRQQLHVMRAAKDSSTLSEKLRETERELRTWKSRAQWAEDTLFGKYDLKGRGGSVRRS